MQTKEYEYLHVIKKIKQILEQWWSLKVLFFNEDHSCELESENNDSFYHIFKSHDMMLSLSKLVKSSVEELQALEEQTYMFRKWDDLGSDVLIKPIFSNREYMSSIVVLSFFKEDVDIDKRTSELKGRLLGLGLSQDLIKEHITKVKPISESDRRHLVELVKVMGDEIITIYKELSNREQRILEINNAYSNKYSYNGMIGRSKSMRELYSLLDKIKSTNSTIIIQGENGTGKELIAKSIHRNSSQSEKTFITQNCSAFNDNLLESELFGHKKGSFTGAISDKKGLFEVADKGTFFLDEIGDTSPSMQVKLLRVLQEGTFIPLGSTEMKKVDVRIIAATNKDLKKMVEEKLFREDLYYRLNVINVQVPPLRERKEDIALLVDYFLISSCKRKDVDPKTIDNSVIKRLYDYYWPGNVRELENEIERLVVLSADNKKISEEYLSEKIKENRKGDLSPIFSKGKLKEAIESVEKEIIQEGLRRTGWNKSQLAKELGISRASLIMKVDRYALDKRKISNR